MKKRHRLTLKHCYNFGPAREDGTSGPFVSDSKKRLDQQEAERREQEMEPARLAAGTKADHLERGDRPFPRNAQRASAAEARKVGQ